MQTPRKPIIVCENLVKIYKVADLEVVALQGLDLIVERGEMLGIVGTSGSGKSTLLNILGGLDRPSAGRVFVDGQDMLNLTDATLTIYQREKIGFVWQQTSRNLIPYLTAIENVELPMTMAAAMTGREKRAWAQELLQAIGLYERRHHRLSQMSGGEQQRVAIAVALANKPVILLGDEPTGEVDTATAQTIMNTFRNLSSRFDLTTIIVTHDPRIAGQVDRVVAIRDGKISTETIRQVSQLEKMMHGEGANAPEGKGISSLESAGKEGGEAEKEQHARQEVILHEYVVLDSAGRLQVPREILDELGIGKRAQMEMGDGFIMIRPAAGQGAEKDVKKLTLEDQLALLFAEQPPAPKKKKGLLGRIRNKA